MWTLNNGLPQRPRATPTPPQRGGDAAARSWPSELCGGLRPQTGLFSEVSPLSVGRCPRRSTPPRFLKGTKEVRPRRAPRAPGVPRKRQRWEGRGLAGPGATNWASSTASSPACALPAFPVSLSQDPSGSGAHGNGSAL